MAENKYKVGDTVFFVDTNDQQLSVKESVIEFVGYTPHFGPLYAHASDNDTILNWDTEEQLYPSRLELAKKLFPELITMFCKCEK